MDKGNAFAIMYGERGGMWTCGQLQRGLNTLVATVDITMTIENNKIVMTNLIQYASSIVIIVDGEVSFA